MVGGLTRGAQGQVSRPLSKLILKLMTPRLRGRNGRSVSDLCDFSDFCDFRGAAATPPARPPQP